MTPACFRFEKIAIEVKSVAGNCKAGFHIGDRFSVETLIPKGLCPFLYHTTLPYLVAIGNGALLNLPEKNFIIVQCPNPTVGVAVKIHQTKEREIQISVINPHIKKSNCPYYHFEIGNNWLVPKGQTAFCCQAYDSIFPYLNGLSTQMRDGNTCGDVSTVTCSSYPNFVTFQIAGL